MRASGILTPSVLIANTSNSLRGFFSCDFVGGSAHWLGSLGNETIDAATFAEWGMDYLKVSTL